MKRRVLLPAASHDERIGSVFNHLFSVILNHENIADGQEVIWDFSNVTFLHPFFIFPLSIFRKNCGKNILYDNITYSIQQYLDRLHFSDMLTIHDDQSLAEILKRYELKSYIPICRFLRQNKNIDSMQTVIQRVIECQTKLDVRLKTPISYLISELVCNIDQHSDSRYGYIYTQYLQREHCLNIGIADDGITIYGSYVKTQKMLDVIGDNEAIALELANQGYSTKNLPKAENRGFGISTTKDLIVNGLGGAFFMLSGGALHRYDKSGSTYVRLPEAISWNGTIILMKIPLTVPDSFDYLKYIR